MLLHLLETTKVFHTYLISCKRPTFVDAEVARNLRWPVMKSGLPPSEFLHLQRAFGGQKGFQALDNDDAVIRAVGSLDLSYNDEVRKQIDI